MFIVSYRKMGSFQPIYRRPGSVCLFLIASAFVRCPHLECQKPHDPCFSPQDAGSQQIGFLLGSCGVSLALTSEVCLKGLPKTPNGEIIQFKGQSAACSAAVVSASLGAIR